MCEFDCSSTTCAAGFGVAVDAEGCPLRGCPCQGASSKHLHHHNLKLVNMILFFRLATDKKCPSEIYTWDLFRHLTYIQLQLWHFRFKSADSEHSNSKFETI